MGFPRNLGGPGASADNAGGEGDHVKRTQAHGRGADHPGERTGQHRAVPPSEQKKRSGMSIRDSEQSILAGRAGNQSEGPAGAKGLPDHGIVQGKDHGCI